MDFQEKLKVVHDLSQAINKLIGQNINSILSEVENTLKKLVYIKNYYIALYDKNYARYSVPYYCDEKIKIPAYHQKTLSSKYHL